jgi:hypothetical protein
MAAPLYISILIAQVASVKVDVPRGEPRAAILFVGRSLHDRFAATQRSANIFDLMTGEEEGEEGFGARSGPSASESSGWGNMVEMLIEPVKKTHTVDVFICIDHAIGKVPADVSQVFEVTGDSQERRGVNCVSKLKSELEVDSRRYDWLINLRADFIFFKKFPAMTSFQPGYVHTRFRGIEGVSGLTSDHISYTPCLQRKCPSLSGPPGHIGYVNDDMVRVVPGALIDFAFKDVRSNATPAGERLLHMPKNWTQMIGIEGELTRFWLERGILTKPLACAGYPNHDRYHHHDKAAPCALHPTKMINCTSDVTIESAHKALCIENHLPDSRC